jgi:surface polysaccharide O-acyltransferase-like enzyme
MTAAPPPVTRSRTAYIDVLICIATFAVVWLHCNGLAHAYSDTPAWTRALVVEVIAYWAVPIFLMCTGVNLFRYRERYTTREFFVKRFQKAVLPFVFWALLAHFLVRWIREDRLTWSDFSPRSLYDAVMFHPEMSIYWFFLPLFAIYLAMPVLTLVKDNRRVLWYFVIVGLVVGSILPLGAEILGLQFNDALDFPLTAGRFIIFPVLGYLLATEELSRLQRVLIYIGGIVGAVIRFVVTYVGSHVQGETYGLLFDYVSIVSVPLAAAVFVAVKSVKWERILSFAPVRISVRQITACSLGIYLVHYYFIMFLLPKWGWTPDRGITQTVGTVVVFLLALALVSVLRVIPGVRRVVPG